MMFGELKPLMDAAQKFVIETINDRIEDCETEIAAQKRKIKRLKAQRSLSEKLMKELAKPPKPFKIPKMTKAQRKAMQQMGASVRPPVATAQAVAS